MNIIINTNKLKEALQVTERVVGKNVSLPILNTILIKVDRGKLLFTSTNLETGIQFWVGAKIEGEGELAIPVRVFSDFISNIQDEKIKLSISKNVLMVSSSNYRTRILGLPTKEFPIIPKVQKGIEIMLKPEMVKKALLSVVDSVSLSETRPELSGVYMGTENGNVFFVATDSFRLSEARVPNGGKEKVQRIIPRSTALEILRLTDLIDGDMKFTITENQLAISTDDMILVSRLIDGRYPEYKKVIPERYTSRLKINRKELEHSVRMASVFSSSISDLLLGAKEGALSIEAKNSDKGDMSARIPCEIEKGVFDIAVNYRYLLDGIKVLQEDTLIIEFTGEGSPLVLRGEGNKDQVYVIMPLRA